jgi:hypothetical protein
MEAGTAAYIQEGNKDIAVFVMDASTLMLAAR